MKKLIEGNPELHEEHPTILERGAYVYYPDSVSPRVELVLNNFYDTSKNDEHWHSSMWSKAGAALIEARRLKYVPEGMGHPSELIGEIRRWFRNNQFLYDTLEQGEQQIRIVLRLGPEHFLDTKELGNGITEHNPYHRWYIQVLSKDALAYPKPVKE